MELNAHTCKRNLFYISDFSLSNQIYFIFFYNEILIKRNSILSQKNSTVLGPKYISAWKLRFVYLMGN
jgi:hypothetical protein